jgi:VanZ family protein
MIFLRKNFILAWCWAIAVFILSTMPTKMFPHVGVSNADKVVHFAMYFSFVVCLLWSMYFNNWKYAALKSFLIAALFGISMEIIQLLTFHIVHRYFEWWDVVSNTLGAFFAAIVLHLYFGKNKKLIK